MHQLHLLPGDVDQLFVLRFQRTDVDVAVLGELVQRHQPLAVGLLGLAHRGVVVARLVVHVELVDDVVDLLAVVGTNRLVDVPLACLAVEKQRGKGVAVSVEGGVQRTEAQLRLAGDHVALLDLAGEQVGKAAHVEDGDRRRQLAVDHDVVAVRGAVDAVRAVRHRHVAGERIVRLLAPVEHRHAVDHLRLAALDRGLDRLDIEDHRPVLLVGGHLRQGDALLAVVAAGDGIQPLVVGVDVVEVAVDHHLPGDLHAVAIDGAEDGDVLRWIVQVTAVVGNRHPVLTVAEYIPGSGVLLRPQTVDVGRVGDLDDLVDLHYVAADARDAGVGLVVDPDIAPIVGAVGERHVRVVGITVEVDPAARLEVLLGLRQQPLGEDALALVGLAPAGRALAVEHRDAHQLAHRRHADDAHLAGLAAAPEAVVVVELARIDVGRPFGGLRLARGQHAVPGHATDAGDRGGAGGALQKLAPRQGRVGFVLLVHHLLLLRCAGADWPAFPLTPARAGNSRNPVRWPVGYWPQWPVSTVACRHPRPCVPRAPPCARAVRVS